MINQISNCQKPIKFTKYLSILTTLFTVFFIIPTVLLRYSLDVPLINTVPISILFTGTYFIILDVIADVYGYNEAKKAIYSAILGYTIFVFIMEFVTNISPNFIPHNTALEVSDKAYLLIFNGVYKTWLAVVFCTLVFDIFNIRILSKLKFLLHGKFFILRSIGSSSLSIILFSFVTNFVAFYSQIIHRGLVFYIHITLVSISAKIFSFIIFTIPASFLCRFLKKSENFDITEDINWFLFESSGK